MKLSKEKQNNLARFKARNQSWSSFSSFMYDKEQWYKRYILGEPQTESAEMKFGKEFAKSIEDGTCPVKELMDKLQKKKEHPFNVVFSDIPLIGYADAFCDVNFKNLDEVKTGVKAWDQARADQHGQFDMYLLMNLITNKVRPEDVKCCLHYIPTELTGTFDIRFKENPVKVYSFETKRTTAQVLNFGVKIKGLYKEMEDYIKNHE